MTELLDFDRCTFGSNVLSHLADKTSTNTTSPANSMLAISENVAWLD
jgi:hypothetical protein